MPPTSPADPTRLLTRREAAAYLRASVTTIDRHIYDGSLRTFRLGSKVMLDPDDLRALLVPHTYGEPS